jgi:hypothetical protein
MGRQEVERALPAMHDEEVRERLTQGDFDALSGLRLTDEERALARDAAGDYPEVGGFSFEIFQQQAAASDIFAKLGDIEGDSLQAHVQLKFNVAARYALGA